MKSVWNDPIMAALATNRHTVVSTETSTPETNGSKEANDSKVVASRGTVASAAMKSRPDMVTLRPKRSAMEAASRSPGNSAQTTAGIG